jgi:hypothetical protein
MSSIDLAIKKLMYLILLFTIISCRNDEIQVFECLDNIHALRHIMLQDNKFYFLTLRDSSEVRF